MSFCCQVPAGIGQDANEPGKGGRLDECSAIKFHFSVPALISLTVVRQLLVTDKTRRARSSRAVAFSAFVHAHSSPSAGSIFVDNIGDVWGFIRIVYDIAVVCDPVDHVLGGVSRKSLGPVAGFALKLRSSHMGRM